MVVLPYSRTRVRDHAMPAAIALRCRKGVAPFVFGQVYLGVPWASNGLPSGKSFMIHVNGRAIYANPALFEPCNPKRWHLWPVTMQMMDGQRRAGVYA